MIFHGFFSKLKAKSIGGHIVGAAIFQPHHAFAMNKELDQQQLVPTRSLTR